MNHLKANQLFDKLISDPIGRQVVAKKLNFGLIEGGQSKINANVAVLIPRGRPMTDSVRYALNDATLYARTFCPVSSPLEERGTLIHANRNTLIGRALTAPQAFTHFLLLDDDIVLQPDTIIKMLETKEPIVLAMHTTKTERPEPLAYEMGAGLLRCVTGYRKGDLVEIDGGGAGCILVTRKVLEDIAAFFYECRWESGMFRGGEITRMSTARQKKWAERGEAEWFRFLPTLSGSFGEDISFFIAARGMGYVPKVATGIEVGHEGSKVWWPADLNATSSARPADGEVQRPLIEEISEPSEWCPEPKLWRMYDQMSAEYEVLEGLASLVRLVKPKLIIDTGSFEGHSAVAMGRALRDNGRGKLVTIELDERLHARTTEHVKNAGLEEFITCIHGSSLAYVPAQPIDMMFSDSGIEVRLSEIEHFKRYMHSFTLVAMHDVFNTPCLRGGLESLEGFNKVWMPTPRGLILMQREG